MAIKSLCLHQLLNKIKYASMQRKAKKIDSRLSDMIQAYSKSKQEFSASKYWEKLNHIHLQHLLQTGYVNFKRTVSLNYFTWTGPGVEEQVLALRKKLPKDRVKRCSILAHTIQHEGFSQEQAFHYNLLTLLLWEYAITQDNGNISAVLSEPEEGSPPHLLVHNKLISQDLANSILEFRSIVDNLGQEGVKSIMELGAGYGRTAFPFLKLMPQIKYFIVDIPPALYIAERYLSSQFHDRSIFKFKTFEKYSQIEEELQRAQLIFLMPDQLELLPKNIVDLFINISSFHEMKLEQIQYYFSLIQRLTRKYFYFKEWKVSKIPYEEATIRENDYPVPNEWRKIYWRDCEVQTRFFEAMLELGK